jgi:hypothetical protein
MPREYPGRILVPFPIEAALSGVADTVGESRRLWYRTQFEVPDDWAGKRILLHFEAVDWETQVWVNGSEIGRHRGGYDPFSFDITEALRRGGAQQITVAVWDPTDAGSQPRGKQVREPRGIFYTSVTGIWGTVWLEPVPVAAIDDYFAIPDLDKERVTVVVEAASAAPGDRARVSVLTEGLIVGAGEGSVGDSITVALSQPRQWSPNDPFLYDLVIQLQRDGQAVDSVGGYLGMREVSLGPDQEGTLRLLLNDRFVFQSGPLDQGYWPDGLYTAPSEAAMAYDLGTIKAMGFNMLRKHVKVEPRRFYTLCDRLGLLVWQDMPNANIPLMSRDSDAATDTAAVAQFAAELRRLIETHRNHPSIVMWVPFNEGWGQHDSEAAVASVRAADPTRWVNHASGWYDRDIGDVLDRHSYPAPDPPEPEENRAVVLGEYGGLGFNVPGHMWTDEGWGYALFPDRESLTQRFEDYMATLAAARERGLSAAVYTQITDIETENNGLLTYDREIAKIEPEAIAMAHKGIFGPRVTRRAPIFIDEATVELDARDPTAQVHYTLDGSEPTRRSPLYEAPFIIKKSLTLTARSYWESGARSRISRHTFTRTEPRPAIQTRDMAPGLQVDYFTSDSLWRQLPDFAALTPDTSVITQSIDHRLADRSEYFGLRFHGFIDVPTTGVYGFHLTSDDGSRLLIDGVAVVDNDGIHGARERSGHAALEAGMHSFQLLFFQGRGGLALELSLDGPEIQHQEIPSTMLFHH